MAKFIILESDAAGFFYQCNAKQGLVLCNMPLAGYDPVLDDLLCRRGVNRWRTNKLTLLNDARETYPDIGCDDLAIETYYQLHYGTAAFNIDKNDDTAILSFRRFDSDNEFFGFEIQATRFCDMLKREMIENEQLLRAAQRTDNFHVRGVPGQILQQGRSALLKDEAIVSQILDRRLSSMALGMFCTTPEETLLVFEHEEEIYPLSLSEHPHLKPRWQ